MAFQGFTSGTLYTPVPNPLFGPLLEQIRDTAELKVTLRGLWLLHRKRGRLKMVTRGEFLHDRTLLRGLGMPGQDPRAEIQRGLRMAVDRGVFLHYRAGADMPEQEAYLLNTASNHNALESLEAEGAPGLEEDPLSTGPATPELGEKSNIFGLYEDNIGMLTPILAEELKEAEESYPQVWVQDAFAVAVTENKRSWRYIAGILRRWAAEGKDHGKPGRHPQKDNRQKHIEDYERRWGGAAGERAQR